jgi:hypothetical protein
MIIVQGRRGIINDDMMKYLKSQEYSGKNSRSTAKLILGSKQAITNLKSTIRIKKMNIMCVWRLWKMRD